MKQVSVTKHALDGRPPYRWTASLREVERGWVVVEASWPLGVVNAGPVSFRPGDTLVEYFATDDWFNAFHISRASGAFAGWYCNVTRPTTFDGRDIHWHDLYLDVIVDPNGNISIEDDDELRDSGIEHRDPALYAKIIDTKDRIIRMIERNCYPFSTTG